VMVNMLLMNRYLRFLEMFREAGFTPIMNIIRLVVLVWFLYF